MTVIVIAAALYFFSPRDGGGPAGDRKSIAILPFENLSADTEDEYFSDGVTHDIITRLSMIADLRVISRASVMSYKSNNKNLREVGEKLGVATILQGSVKRAEGRVQIASRLVDVRTDESIWTETYKRGLSEIFKIQSDIVERVAHALEAKVTTQEAARIRAEHTGDMEAYDYYLRSRESYYRNQHEDNELAISLFEKALLYDPDYAPAHAGLGHAFAQRVQRFGFPREWLDPAIQASERAVAVDSTLADGYKALALAYYLKGCLKKSVAASLKALNLDPNHVLEAGGLGRTYVRMGRPDKAITWMRKAMDSKRSLRTVHIDMGTAYGQLNKFEEARRWLNMPPAVLSVTDDFVSCAALVRTYLSEQRYDEARSRAEGLVQRRSRFTGGYFLLARTDAFAGNLVRAKTLFQAALAVASPNDMTLYSLADIYYACSLWKLGEHAEARRLFNIRSEVLRAVIDDGDESIELREALAMSEAIQGNETEAIDWLQSAFDAGYTDYLMAEQNPYLENLHDDARFKELMSQMRARVEEMRRRVGEYDR